MTSLTSFADDNCKLLIEIQMKYTLTLQWKLQWKCETNILSLHLKSSAKQLRD